jgi:hypothetical protein
MANLPGIKKKKVYTGLFKSKGKCSGSYVKKLIFADINL